MGTTLRRKQSIFEDPSFEVYKNIETKSIDSGSNSSQYTNSSTENKDNTDKIYPNKYDAIAQLDIEYKKQMKSDGASSNHQRTSTTAIPQLPYQQITSPKPVLRHSISMPVYAASLPNYSMPSPVRLRSTGEQLFNAIPSSPYSPCNYSPKTLSANSNARITMSDIVDFAKTPERLKNRKTQSLKTRKMEFDDSFNDVTMNQ